MVYGNIVVLLICLAAIIIFKSVVGDRTGQFMDNFAPPGDGSGSGETLEIVDDYATERAVGVALELLHRAVSDSDNAID
jgi:hypothetical protein